MQDPGKGGAPPQDAPQEHTPEGAPTDEAHQEAGDGTLTGSVPGGLTADELDKAAEQGGGGDAGSG